MDPYVLRRVMSNYSLSILCCGFVSATALAQVPIPKPELYLYAPTGNPNGPQIVNPRNVGRWDPTIALGSPSIILHYDLIDRICWRWQPKAFIAPGLGTAMLNPNRS